MFQVHILKKRLPMHRSVESLLKSALLLKAAGLKNTRHQMEQGWPPESIFNPDPNKPDHPPFSFDPQTGELTPGLHGIDAVAQDLDRRFAKAGIKVKGKDAIQAAIEMNRGKHPEGSNHHVPDFDDVQWRKAVVGGPGTYQKGKGADERLNRTHEVGPDGRRHFIAYHTNSGIPDESGVPSRTFLESPSFPINAELGHILREMGLPDVNKIPYVTNNHVPIHMVNPDLVPIRGKEMEEMMSGRKPDRLAPKHLDLQHGTVFSDQVAHILPDVFFSVAAGKSRGQKDKEGRGKYERMASEIMDTMSEAGVAINEEEADTLSRMPVADLILGRPGHWATTRGGKFGSLMKRTVQELDFDPESEVYNIHHSHSEKGAHDQGRGRHHTGKMILAMAASVGADKVKGLDIEHGGHDFDQKHRDMAEKVISLYSEAQGRKPIDLGTYDHPTELHPRAAIHEGIGEAMDVPGHFHENNRYFPLHELAPMGESRVDPSVSGPPRVQVTPSAQPPPVVPAAPAPPPVVAPSAPTPTLFDPRFQRPGPVRTPTPAELAARQEASETFAGWHPSMLAQATGMPEHRAAMMTQGFHPAQRFFDPMSGQFVRGDGQVHVDAIMKSLESMQLSDALSDDRVMSMIPNGNYDLGSIMDVGLVAKALGITSQDVRALYSSSGDWHRVAEEWKVSPEVVKAVKVVFR